MNYLVFLTIDWQCSYFHSAICLSILILKRKEEVKIKNGHALMTSAMAQLVNLLSASTSTSIPYGQQFMLQLLHF